MKKLNALMFFLALLLMSGVSFASTPDEKKDTPQVSVSVADQFFTFNGAPGQEKDPNKYGAGDTNCGSPGGKLCKIRVSDQITLADALTGMPAGPYTNGQTYTVTVLGVTYTVTIFTKA